MPYEVKKVKFNVGANAASDKMLMELLMATSKSKKTFSNVLSSKRDGEK